MITDVTPGHCGVCDEGMPECCFDCRLKYMARWQTAHPIGDEELVGSKYEVVAEPKGERRRESEFDTPSYDGLAAVNAEIDRYRDVYL